MAASRVLLGASLLLLVGVWGALAASTGSQRPAVQPNPVGPSGPMARGKGHDHHDDDHHHDDHHDDDHHDDDHHDDDHHDDDHHGKGHDHHDDDHHDDDHHDDDHHDDDHHGDDHHHEHGDHHHDKCKHHGDHKHGGAGCNCKGNCKGKTMGGRLAAFKADLVQTLDELDEATAEVITLEHDIHEKSSKGREIIAEIDVLEYTIDHLRGHGHCNDHQFWCGGDSIDCVDKIAVCDNHKDCKNGHDEDHCEDILPEGSEWIGTVVYDHCTYAPPAKISFTVEAYSRTSYFPSRPQVDVTFHIERDTFEHGDEHLSLVGHGFFNYADHELVVPPPDKGNQLALHCHFDGVHNEHCHGHTVHEATGLPCAEFYFARH